MPASSTNTREPPLKHELKAITQSKFVRNVAIVATGTAGAQAITMAFAPLVTRLYGSEAFGMLGTFMAILGVMSPIAALTYPFAIVLSKSDTDAKSIAKFSATLALAVASVTAIVVVAAGDWIAQALCLETIAGFLLLVPVAMLFSAFQQILTQWLIRKKQFRIIARVSVIQAFSINSAKAGIGLFHPMDAVLIVIAAIGQAFHASLLWSGIRGRTATLPSGDEKRATVRELAKRHRDFPLYRAPQVFLNAVSQGLPIIMIAAYFGASSAGFLTLTKTVLAAPVALIGVSVGNVFYPRAVELYRDEENLKRFLLRTTYSLFLTGSVMFLPIIIFGPWIFAFVFGDEWELAGVFGRWVSLWMVFSLAARPVISVIPVVGGQRQFLLFECIFIPVKIGSLYTGFFFDNAIVSVAWYSLVSCLFYLFLYISVLRKIEGRSNYCPISH